MKIIKVNNYTYIFILIAFLCGYIKNAIIILIIVLIHELGHVFFIKRYNEKIINITIFPFGGITNIEKDINTPINEELLIASGGVIFQLFIYLFITFIPLTMHTKELMINYNTIIILFNLIPIIPLDGSIIINCILNRFISFTRSYIIKNIISIITIVLFVIFNYKYSLNNYLIISFLIYKTCVSINNYKYIKYRFYLERYLNNYRYKRIKNNTKNINGLKLDTKHYFRINKKVINEREKIQELFDKYKHF